MYQYFELGDLPAQRSSDRGFVFIICIVQVVGIEQKIQPILFYVPFIVELSCLSGGGGVHGSTVAFRSCPG